MPRSDHLRTSVWPLARALAVLVLIAGCSKSPPTVGATSLRYSSPPDLTIQEFIANMERATGRRIRMSDCVQAAPERIRFFRPVTVAGTEAFGFFSSVLAVYMVELVSVADLPGDDLLAESSDSTGLTRHRMRYPFLHPSNFPELASNHTDVVSTAIPLGGITAGELDQILDTVPRNRNKEGWITGRPPLRWLIGYMHPSTAAAIETKIEDANRRHGR